MWSEDRITVLKDIWSDPQLTYHLIADIIMKKCPGGPVTKAAVRHKADKLDLPPRRPGSPGKKKIDIREKLKRVYRSRLESRRSNVKALNLNGRNVVDRSDWERPEREPNKKITLSPGVGEVLPAMAYSRPDGEAQDARPTILDLGLHQCRWPLDGSPMRFCGQPTSENRPYCPSCIADHKPFVPLLARLSRNPAPLRLSWKKRG